MATVRVGPRLHFGFQNLSLARDRLYGGIGVALDGPPLVVEASRDDTVTAPTEIEPYAQTAVSILAVPGARITVPERFGRHVGLGSGTQTALGTLQAVADAYEMSVSLRACAPQLGRGRRSGVGVATFQQGKFIVDAGHPTHQFADSSLPEGNWTVPRPIVAREIPASWRFVLITPDVPPGKSGEDETASMNAVLQRATPENTDEIAVVLTRQLLPALVESDVVTFGAALSRIDRLNGTWYADQQGGIYRPPAGELIDTLTASEPITGAGQSSWGPTVYGVTTADRTESAVETARSALSEAEVEGTVRIAKPRNEGATRKR